MTGAKKGTGVLSPPGNRLRLGVTYATNPVCCVAIIAAFSLATTDIEAATKPTGIKPLPLKANVRLTTTTDSDERCIYHLPGQRFYHKTKAERCYASESDAAQDGCRRSKV